LADEPLQWRKYWKRGAVVALAHTPLAWRERWIPTTIITVIAYFAQWHLGIRGWWVTVQILITTIGAYFVVSLGSFLWNLFRAPAQMDREGSRRESELREEIGRLKSKPTKVDAHTRAWILAKVDGLAPDVRAVLKRMVLHGGGERARIEGSQPNAWGILYREELVMIDKTNYWCTVNPAILDDLRAIFEAEL
jgi:hypothetical protein